ncbi:MAG: TIGR00300 family protein [Planctomycetota bacterium]|jgi:lysine-ketoglutarate reductase/saccharopine dehydrogenase-like protein (TIGR00300 family)|nr:TIGR00300 family protein [Planctomycetota bacterium]
MVTEKLILDGHILDSLTLSKVLDRLSEGGVQFDVKKFEVGHGSRDESHAEIELTATDEAQLRRLAKELEPYGGLTELDDATVAPAPADGVFPDGFYSTTNLETCVRIRGSLLKVEHPEMDCGIVIRNRGSNRNAETIPIHRVRKGDLIVTGEQGLRVAEMHPEEERGDAFHFMGSEVSMEKSKERAVFAVAEAMREARAAGERILFVGGPAIIHTGAGRSLERMILEGWIDVLFAGNGFATHDMECALYSTSLGVNLNSGRAMPNGHQHHLRTINQIRQCGSIRQAVEQGLLQSGIMHACVVSDVDYVLAGSIRDDGPLPDVITDVTVAQDTMREKLEGVGLALMAASLLHSIATGNMLPARIRTFCIDANADSVLKLTDRGTHQVHGIVTDCSLFLKELGEELCGGRP